jgi:vacuolar-type H+-ATPase subunit I/STV1
MAVQHEELQKFIADLPRKAKRERNLYILYSIITVTLGAAWLTYSFYQVKKLRNESQQLRREVLEQQDKLEKTKSEFKRSSDELETVAQELRIPLEELHNLKSFGFLGNSEGVSDLRSYLEQSTKAKAELRNIKSPNLEKSRRANVPIRYYLRASDNGRVKQAIESLHQDYGFTAHEDIAQKEPNTYTNAIWIMHNNVTAEDVKLIAYYLVLRGIQVRYIGPPTSTLSRVRSARESIWVLAEPKVKDESALTVEKIKDLSLSSLAKGTNAGNR